jgi:hypothetical protein
MITFNSVATFEQTVQALLEEMSINNPPMAFSYSGNARIILQLPRVEQIELQKSLKCTNKIILRYAKHLVFETNEILKTTILTANRSVRL